MTLDDLVKVVEELRYTVEHDRKERGKLVEIQGAQAMEIDQLRLMGQEQSTLLRKVVQLLEGAFGEGGLVERVRAIEVRQAANNGRLMLITGVGLSLSVLIPVVVSILLR